MAHALNIVEYRTPLRARSVLASAISVHGYGESHPGITGIIVDNVQLPLRSGVGEAPLQRVEQELVEEFQLN